MKSQSTAKRRRSQPWLLILLWMSQSYAFTSPTRMSCSAPQKDNLCSRDELDVKCKKASQSAMKSRLFTAEAIDQETKIDRIRDRSAALHKHFFTVALSWILIGARPALASSSSSSLSLLSRSKRLLKPLFWSVAIFISITSAYATRQAHQRQASDATSEWSRYANDPAARGRAVVAIGLKILPFWIRQRLLARAPERRSELRAKAGTIFADSLLKLGPLYIKLGQIMSCRDNLLPAEWSTAMERLQDRVPAKSGAAAMELAYAAMGGRDVFERTFVDFDSHPLAAASLGQVHRAVLRDTNDTVAVKLQRPKLREIYDQDLQLLTKIAKTVDGMRRGQVGGVSQSWTEIFADAKEILYREIDYRDEADNGLRFNADFGLGKEGKPVTPTAKSLDGEALPSAASWLRAPHVYRNVSSEQVLVMEFVPSIKITSGSAQSVSMEDREFLADSLARVYLRSFCVHRFFSTDPHPGNLGIEMLKDGPPRLVMYDFGQACELQPDQAEGILDVIEAIVDMDSDRCVEAFTKMGVLKENADVAMVQSKVRDNFETGKITVKRKKLKKAGYKFKEKTTNNASASIQAGKVKDTEVMGFFTLPAEYAFVARALSQLNGVGKTLDPDFDFISSAAPNIVEIKGAGNYVKDEWTKWVRGVEKGILDWQKPLLK